MKISIFLVVLCLGTAFAAPAVDPSFHAEPNELIVIPGLIVGAIKGIIVGIIQAIIGTVVKTAMDKKPVRLETEVNVPADEIAEEFQAGDVVIPEPEARKLEKAIEDILVAMGLGEDSNGAPALRK
uniref:Uncharacterized protein n=1 Tax=Pipistrellus kuhlii TaxID=59472 RepID=A0A7J7SV93_PIPKU|nr:hypothetical protein mPipKuh1_009760 [Pipistrellus kuhlii]KAF6292321.1 hypothetical protein mPipKuh1_009761 [Pipistrellus kuhlii]